MRKSYKPAYVEYPIIVLITAFNHIVHIYTHLHYRLQRLDQKHQSSLLRIPLSSKPSRSQHNTNLIIIIKWPPTTTNYATLFHCVTHRLSASAASAPTAEFRTQLLAHTICQSHSGWLLAGQWGSRSGPFAAETDGARRWTEPISCQSGHSMPSFSRAWTAALLQSLRWRCCLRQGLSGVVDDCESELNFC